MVHPKLVFKINTRFCELVVKALKYHIQKTESIYVNGIQKKFKISENIVKSQLCTRQRSLLSTCAQFLSDFGSIIKHLILKIVALDYHQCSLGHIIHQNGMHFSRERIDKSSKKLNNVSCSQGLTEFMGLINCFGDHIPHLADERRLLRQMEKEWSLNIWTIQQKKCSFFVDVETTLHKTSFVTQLKDEDDNTFTHIPRRDLFRDVLDPIRDKRKGFN